MQFSDEEEIDVEIKQFNGAYQKYSELVTDNPELDKLEENPLPEKQSEGLVEGEQNEIHWLRLVKEKP